MLLIEAIETKFKSLALAGKWSEVAEAVNSLKAEQRDDTPVTYARIRALFGEEVRRAVANGIRALIKSANEELAGEMQDLHTVMLNESIGFRLDLPERQAMLQQIATLTQWPKNLVDSIAALGVREVPLYSSPYTAEQCRQAWLENERATNISTVRERVNAALNKLYTVNHTDGVSELAAIAAEL